MKNQTLVVLYEVSELGSLKTLMTFHIGVKISMDFSHHLRCVCVCVRVCVCVCIKYSFLYISICASQSTCLKTVEFTSDHNFCLFQRSANILLIFICHRIKHIGKGSYI